jgi:hypothetical protein
MDLNLVVSASSFEILCGDMRVLWLSSLNGNSARTLVLKRLENKRQRVGKGFNDKRSITFNRTEQLKKSFQIHRGWCNRFSTNMKKLMCGQRVSQSRGRIRGSTGRNTVMPEGEKNCRGRRSLDSP